MHQVLAKNEKTRRRVFVAGLISTISFFLLFGIEFRKNFEDNSDHEIILPENSQKMAFVEYFGEFGNPINDGKWVNWRKKIYKHSNEYYEPPNHLATQLFPQLGLYSSHDKSLLRYHCSMLYEAGIDGIILNWKGINRTDENSGNETLGFADITLQYLLDAADEFHLKVFVQIPQYESRSNETIYEDIVYLNSHYFNHPSYFRIDDRPAVAIYDPHLINYLFLTFENAQKENISCYYIGSIVELFHIGAAVEEGFDSVFSYFASESSTYCSNISRWKYIQKDCIQRGVDFIPTVAPGFNEEKVNRWSSKNKRSRDAGLYYDRMFEAAININPSYIVINSFNNWFEATNIEPAIDKNGYQFCDELWGGIGSDSNFFMRKTKEWIDKFKGF